MTFFSVVSSKEFYSQTKKLCHGFTSDIAIGGITRQLSVKNGLEYAKKFNPDYVLIHDCARPFIDDVLINNLIRETKENKGCIPVVPIKDSMKRIDNKTKEKMKEVLKDIQSGKFTKQWMDEHKSGQKNFLKMRKDLANHPIEKVGKELRAMMPWIGKNKLVDKDKN